ncbi:hypothetical protein [Teredinibacter haidensis]|uniref:hypothetical protein n=1 Tax=Teredinibacter haidensis TaxID=2731755 RepID=UPI0011150FFB|nr:hypothetical protein [Teredinibacter haidensis]
MGILANLLGCKTTPTRGPDFLDTRIKVIHLNTGLSIHYEMPGNMTSMFNYGERYTLESSSTLQVDISDASKYEQDYWRNAYYIDGATWDYESKKNKGIAGQLGSLNVRISVNRHEEHNGSLPEHIEAAYEKFLNGPNGLNTEMRQGVEGEAPLSDEELGDLIVRTPTIKDTREYNGVTLLTWSIANEHPGRYFHYFVYPIDAQHFLSLRFYHVITAKNNHEVNEVHSRAEQDIEQFMQRVTISK